MNGRQFNSSSLFGDGNSGGLKTLLSLIYHLPNFLRLFWRLLWDMRIPAWRKGVFLAAGLYVISPIDFFPDRLATFFGIGYLDDVVVITFAARWFVSGCPREIVQQHVKRIEEEDALEEKK